MKKLIITVALVVATNLSITKQPDAETACLAKAIYHEARGESRPGKLAVAWVVLNRTKNNKFPSTACEVIYQPYQFTNIKFTNKIPEEYFKLAYEAKLLHNNNKFPALYFHNLKVKPRWNKKPLTKIGNHVFYH
jgi:spore germination cell wall hydrolase CwlJ-like protein